MHCSHSFGKCYLQELAPLKNMLYSKNATQLVLGPNFIATNMKHLQPRKSARIQTAQWYPISKHAQKCIFPLCSYLPCSVNIYWLCQQTRIYICCNLLCCCPTQSFATLWAVALMFCPESCTVICSACLAMSEAAFLLVSLLILHFLSLLLLQALLFSWLLLWSTCLCFFLCSPDLLLFLHRNLLTQAFFQNVFIFFIQTKICWESLALALLHHIGCLALLELGHIGFLALLELGSFFLNRGWSFRSCAFFSWNTQRSNHLILKTQWRPWLWIQRSFLGLLCWEWWAGTAVPFLQNPLPNLHSTWRSAGWGCFTRSWNKCLWQRRTRSCFRSSTVWN